MSQAGGFGDGDTDGCNDSDGPIPCLIQLLAGGGLDRLVYLFSGGRKSEKKDVPFSVYFDGNENDEGTLSLFAMVFAAMKTLRDILWARKRKGQMLRHFGPIGNGPKSFVVFVAYQERVGHRLRFGAYFHQPRISRTCCTNVASFSSP